MSLEEDRRIRAERMSDPLVFLESTFNPTMEERTTIELAEADELEEAAGVKPLLSESSAAYLWLCCVIKVLLSSQILRSDQIRGTLDRQHA